MLLIVCHSSHAADVGISSDINSGVFIQYFYFFSANLGAKLLITHNGTTVPGLRPSGCHVPSLPHPLLAESNYFYSTLDSVSELLEALQQGEGSGLVSRSVDSPHQQSSAMHSNAAFKWGVQQAGDSQNLMSSGGRKPVKSRSIPPSASKVVQVTVRQCLCC